MAAVYKVEKYLDDIESTGIGEDGVFCEDYVKQVQTASSMLFRDMCQMTGCKNSLDLTPQSFYSKPSTITKAQLTEWLYSAIFLLDRCSIPLMQMAVDLKSDIDTMKDEKITDQKTIIDLQNKLLEKKDEEISAVQKTVETELKSYSSVLQQSCATALAPKKIVSAVKKVSQDENCSQNVIVFGLPEEDTENVDSKVSKLLEHLEEKPVVTDCRRIGQAKPGSVLVRPVRFRVKSSDIVYQILRKARRLKGVDGYQSVFISPDRNQEERISRKKLVDELKEKRQKDPSLRYFIRRGEIVSAEKG